MYASLSPLTHVIVVLPLTVITEVKTESGGETALLHGQDRVTQR